MIIAVIAAAAGVLGAVLTVLLLQKRKLGGAWGASLLVCALILTGTGGLGIARRLQNRAEEYGYIYLALCYLEEGQTDPAALYLKRVTEHTGFDLTAAQALLEQMRGNDTVARLRLDVLEEIQDGSDDQRSILTRLRTWNQMENGLQGVTAALREQLPLSDGRRQELDISFALETGGDSGDGVSGEGGSPLLQINRALGRQDWNGAVSGAVQLVEEDPSQSNRLLLAEVIADATYSGSGLSTSQFTGGEPVETDTQARESEELMARYEELTEELALIQQEMALVDGEEREALASRASQMTEESEEILRQARNIFALRALGSISDIHSLEAQVVRARLYYAMRNYEEAIDTLRSSANSVQAALSANRSLANSLQLVSQIYETQGEAGVDTPEFREELQVLMGGVHPEIIQLGLTPLAADFADRIVSDQKTYGSGLYVVGLDASQYPRIQVRLGGQAQVLEDVAGKEQVVVKDTRREVSGYEVQYDSDGEDLNSICFVVDVSGSMAGAPLLDAREAISRFLDGVSGNTRLALVQFESGAQTLVELTDSVAAMQTAVGSLSALGGTDITAGIAEGARALQDAPGTRTMIVMADGQSNVDLAAVETAVDAGITIFTVGFGSVNDELLQTIADMSGGQYIRADSSTELMNVYSSLQGIIGNTVTITYTAQDTDEEERYFFLMSEEYGFSARQEYAAGSARQEEAPAVTLSSEPVLLYRDELENYVQAAEDYPVSYGGTGLDNIALVYADREMCSIRAASPDYMEIGVPSDIPSGSYGLLFRTQDGEEYVFEDMLLVGDRLSVPSCRAGGLRLTASRALVLEDGSVALSGEVWIREVPSQDGGTVETLSLLLRGALIFPDAGASPGEGGEELDLGDAGVARGWGTLSVTGDDKAFWDSSTAGILQGDFLLDYGGTNSRFFAGEEGER